MISGTSCKNTQGKVFILFTGTGQKLGCGIVAAAADNLAALCAPECSHVM
jgi:hypothetical protein